jgi:hypothetical protein
MSGHDKLSHGGVLTDLGGMRNWEALVDDLRQGLVRWMRKYLAELPGALIYNVLQQCRPIWRNHAGGRERGVSHRGDLSWRSLGDELRQSLGSHYDSRRCGKMSKGVAQPRWRVYIPVTAARPHRRQVDEATGRNSALKFIHSEIFSPGAVFCSLLGANHDASVNPSTRVTDGEVQRI